DLAAFGGVPRARFLQALAAEGIPCSCGYGVPLYRQTFFQKKAFGPYMASRHPVDYTSVHCPVCEKACAEEACWLTHPMLLGTRDDMDDIVRAVSKIHDHRKELQ
ncbi:MAG TPA: DegT/DnrJ/EryC1/StrS family aminotransferase, partial [Planctomycetota bacterium]|nr:DegT/DnrJ/EryC1/StrS family aminotransferase [Planctomycetota bacterium]